MILLWKLDYFLPFTMFIIIIIIIIISNLLKTNASTKFESIFSQQKNI